jgi:hypothetical protein
LEPYSRTRRSTKLSHTPILNCKLNCTLESALNEKVYLNDPLRCPKLFARYSLCTILTADAFRAPFIVHRTRSHSSYQTEPHSILFFLLKYFFKALAIIHY